MGFRWRWRVVLVVLVVLVAAKIYQHQTGNNALWLIFGSPNPPVVWKPLDPNEFVDEGAAFLEGLAAYNREDFVTALALWTPLAEAGHAEAQYRVGRFYYRGWGVNRNLATAADWFEKAAKKENSNSLFVLGRMHGIGEYYSKNERAEVDFYKRAMDRGNVNGLFGFAQAHYFGWGVPENKTKAYPLFLAAEAAGNCRANQNLGEYFRYGYANVDPNMKKAYKYYRQARIKGCPARFGEFVVSIYLDAITREEINREIEQRN